MPQRNEDHQQLFARDPETRAEPGAIEASLHAESRDVHRIGYHPYPGRRHKAFGPEIIAKSRGWCDQQPWLRQSTFLVEGPQLMIEVPDGAASTRRLTRT